MLTSSRQMCIVVSCDCLTGIFAGFAVFSTIGYLAKELHESVENYAGASGPGLAFITYPEALTHMPASSVFSVIFFLMLLALGLGTQVKNKEIFYWNIRFDLVCYNRCSRHFDHRIISTSSI